MLPVISLSDTPDLDCHLAFKRREAEWKRLVSKTHRDWCLCGSYRNHFISSTEPLQKESCTTDEDDVIVLAGGATGGEPITQEDGLSDADIVAAGGEP